MKRVITFLMVLAMVLSLGVTALAAGGTGAGSITITNAVQTEEYAVYKIFNATYEGTSVTYTIKPTDEFFDDLFGTDGTTHNDYFEYHAATGVVTRKSGKTDAELFAYLGTLVASATATDTETATSTTLQFTGLDTGYYVIQRTSGSANAVTITTAKPDAEVNDKNSLPGGDFDKTTDKPTADVGDTINWKLAFTATNYSKEQKVLSYTITDTLTPTGWAAIDTSSIVVKVDGTPVAYTLDPSSNSNGFELVIPWVDADGNFIYPATAKVEVSYSATVLEAAATKDPSAVVNQNYAELDWSCNTNPDKPDDKTETEVFNMGFTKVDGTNGKGLIGAKFTLTNSLGQDVKLSGGTNGVYTVDPDGASNEVETPADGQVVILGLDKDTYYLTETAAPAGYNMLTAPVEVIVGESAEAEIKIGTDTYKLYNEELDIANNSGVELPSTGGAGTVMLISFGTMVAVAFAILMITQKKMSIYRD